MRTVFCSHFGAEPYYNMAFDEVMLDYCQAHSATALVRLYCWKPGAITIGFNQTLERALDWSRLGDTPVVRRITGGRALYHDESELTYAVALNLSGTAWSNQSGAASRVYELIADTLGTFLRQVGIETTVMRRSSPAFSRRSDLMIPPCFASAARFELMAGERKIAASAQRQSGMTILQHGSLKLGGTASHAALPGLPGSAPALQPLDSKQFEVYACAFRQVLEKHWPGNVARADLATIPGLETRLKEVATNPLTRRDTFEQSAPPKGL